LTEKHSDFRHEDFQKKILKKMLIPEKQNDNDIARQLFRHFDIVTRASRRSTRSTNPKSEKFMITRTADSLKNQSTIETI